MKTKYLRFALMLLTGIFLFLGAQTQSKAQQVNNPGQQQADAAPDKEKPKYAQGRFIVKFKSEGPEAVNEDVEYLLESKGKFKHAVSDKSDSLDELMKRHRAKKAKSVFIERYGLTTEDARQKQNQLHERSKIRHQSRSRRVPKDVTPPDLSNIYVIEVPPGSDIEAIVQEFQADPHVEYAQPDHIMEAYMVPNDPYYSSYGSWGQLYDDLWGLKKIQAEQAWNITQGEGIIVAVVDTGLDYNHPDIAANVWTNIGEIPNNSLDDDGNGYVDDVRGWDFDYPFSNDPMDGHGHGTHVAGTIAAISDNGIGIVGVAPKVKIMPVKALSDAGPGSALALAQSLVYAAENGADVINNSWGCSEPCPDGDPLIKGAFQTAYSLGTVVVFAAGNDSNDVSQYSPVNMTNPKPIVVSAVTQDDTLPWFTNFGVLVDVAAPGGGFTASSPAYDPWKNILSLKAENTGDSRLIVGTNYLRNGGTSMAAPHVAGVAALILAHHPEFTNEEVRQVLRVSADDLNSPGFDVRTGAGRINAAKALTISSVLSAKIESPVNGERYSPNQIVPIIGTAWGSGLKEYELFYGVGMEPSSWVSLGAPVQIPVQNAILGTWDVSNLIDGHFLLKIVVTSTNNVEFEDVIGISVNGFKQITSDPSTQWHPEISGNLVVWEDSRNRNNDVYLYDLITNTERQITANTSQQGDPTISGNLIVWEDNRNGNWDIYLYDLSTNAERQITTNTANQMDPVISGNLIVWEDNRNGNWDIYLYDLSTNTERQITTNTAIQSNPAISGSLVVWDDYRHNNYNGNVDIYLYDVGTNIEKQLTTHPSTQVGAAISGNLVVWRDSRNGNDDIYLHDLSTNTERQITANTSHERGPAISGNLVVWIDSRNGNDDIYLYDLSTNTERQITAHPAVQWDPAISGNLVVWHDYRNSNYDIYIQSLVPLGFPELVPIGNKVVNETNTLIFTVSVAGSGGDMLTYSASGLPAGATFNASTRTFRWTPTASQSGSYAVTFTVADSWGLSDSETITIAVVNVNQPPVLATIGNKSVNMESNLTFAVSAVDPDGDMLTYSASGLPPGATFSASTRAFNWTTTASQAGSYDVTFTVMDPWGLSDSETIVITVGTTIPSICGDGVCQINEDYNICPGDCSLSNNCGDGVCTAEEGFTRCQFDCPSQYCGDGFCSVWDNENGQNCQPDCSVTCGDGICQADEGTIRCEIDCLPPGCGDGICTPDEGYMKCERDCPSMRCGDGFCSAMDYEDGQNCQPDCSLTCGDGFCTPDEGYMKCERDCPSMRCGDGFCSAMDYENGQTCQPDCSLTCGDGICTPDEGYQKCEMDCPSPNCGDGFCSAMDYENGQNCQPDCSLTCGDGFCTPDEGYMKCERDCPSMRCGDGFCSAMDYENGQTCQPDCSVTCGDNICTPDEGYQKCEMDCPSMRCGDGFCAIADGENQTTCGPDCQPPVLDAIGHKTINEGELLSFNVTATDPGGGMLTYSAEPLPSGATFSGQTFSWTPDYDQAGSYDIIITASDGVLADSEAITITVANVNRTPVLAPVGDKSVNEGQLLGFTVSATDPDGDPLSWKLGSLPDVNADGFIDWADVDRIMALLGQTSDTDEKERADINGDGIINILDVQGGISSLPAAYVTGLFETATGTFRWAPGYDQAGSHNVTFRASDGTLSASETITIAVVDVPMPDLITSSLSTMTTTVTPGNGFNISNTAANQGTASAGSFTVAFSLSKDVVYGGTDDIAFTATRAVTSLAAGANSAASTTLTVPSTTPLGNYYVCAKADSGGTVSESDELNNGRCTTSPIQVALPDLVMTQISGPATGATGTSISLANIVKNQGVSSTGSFTVGFYLSTDATITTTDTRVGTRGVGSLAAGSWSSATTTLTVPSTLTAGTYYIGAIADYNNSRAETSETNNALTGNTIVLTIGADLVMTAVSGPASGTKGTAIGISNTVKNQGTGGVASFAIGLYLSTDANITTTDLRIGTRSIGSLAAGASSSATSTVTIPSTIAGGTYYIGAIADYGKTRLESNETNNARAGNTIVVQ